MSDIVLGVDPGIASVGWALVGVVRAPNRPDLVLMPIAAGTIRTQKLPGPAAADTVRRLVEIGGALQRLVRGDVPGAPMEQGIAALFDAHRVRAVCVESMSQVRSASAAAKVAAVWGMLVMAAVSRGVPILHQSPNNVKAAIGAKNASKLAIKRAIDKRYGRARVTAMVKGVIPSQREHAYDALAIATTCAISLEGTGVLA